MTPMQFKQVRYEDATVGMRVQDYWGRTGTIRWVGKFDKKSHSPTKEAGHYYGVEYDEDSTHPQRSDGAWEGTRYFTCAPQRGMLCKCADIYYEINPVCVQMLRTHFGERVATWHDFELVKFGIARQFDMVKVIDMLERHLAWRDSFQPSADEYFPPGIVDDYPCGYTGTVDYDDNLIYCERPGNGGRCYSSDFVRRYTLPTIARWHVTGVEMGMQRMRASGYRNKRVCYIVDLLKVDTMTRHMIEFARTLAAVEQDNYPENIGRVFIVNCPGFFRLAWKLISVFIDERTNHKIHFVAPGKAQEVMRQCMPEEEIPDFCGGTSTKWLTTLGGRIGSDDPARVHASTLKAATMTSTPMASSTSLDDLHAQHNDDVLFRHDGGNSNNNSSSSRISSNHRGSSHGGSSDAVATMEDGDEHKRHHAHTHAIQQ